MTPEFKAEWIAALRSGKYKQGRHLLRQEHDGEVFHCCLGVAAQLKNQSDNPWDLKYSDAEVPDTELWNLIKMNDDYGRSFDHIAGYIEAML